MIKGEYFNSISHLVGASLALVGGTVLVTLAAVQGDVLKIGSIAVYGLTLFLLFLASTLYHSLRGRAKRVFQKLDHGAIFLLIAGTYTPVMLVALNDRLGYTLLVVIWALAGLGILIDNLPVPGPRILPVVIYMIMGWLGMVFVDALITAMPAASFIWLVVGGVLFTLGVVFFVLDQRYPWCHEIWHVFVLAGSASHFVAISLLL
jgi:hemolysin III